VRASVTPFRRLLIGFNGRSGLALHPKPLVPSRPMRVKKQKKNKAPEASSLLEFATRPDAAGIDVAAEEIVAAVPHDRAAEFVRTFGSFTRDLHAVRDWLLVCRIKTVALESTGNYWVPLYQILEEAGLEVFLVNARDVKAIGGRKTDVADAQWLQQLHAAGLLRKSSGPRRTWRALALSHAPPRQPAAKCDHRLQHMQKTLNECNLQIHHVFSDLDGQSAQRILEAILAGERDPHALAKLRDARCRTPLPKVLKALEGDYRAEYLFVLGQSLARWKQTQETLAALEVKIQAVVAAIQIEEPAPVAAPAIPATDAAPATAEEPAMPEGPAARGSCAAAAARRPQKQPGFRHLRRGPSLLRSGPGAGPGRRWFHPRDPDERVGGPGADPGGFPLRQSLLLLAHPLSGEPHFRREDPLGQDPAERQPGRHRAAHLRPGPQPQRAPVGPVRAPHEGAAGQAEGITATRAQAGAHPLRFAHQQRNYDEAKAFALTPAKQARKLKQLLAQAERLGFKLTPAT